MVIGRYSGFSDLCNTGQNIKREAEIIIQAFLASCGQTMPLS